MRSSSNSGSNRDLKFGAACDAFEASWRRGEKPRIESAVAQFPERMCNEVLVELIRIELELRGAAGESVSQDEYERRFPDSRQAVSDAFSQCDSTTLETVAHAPHDTGLHVRCPHCHNPIELVADAELESISCPSCGDAFTLSGGSPLQESGSRGTEFAHFELLEPIGLGAFGSVWKARDTRLDRIVAIKFPRKEQLSPQEAEAFLREARAAAQLKHPNIVGVHEVGRHNDRLFIVSDYISGGSLESRLSDGPLASREAAELCQKIAGALQHAHDQGVVHRDLKPANLLLDDTGEPLIADFGLAKRVAGEVTMTMEGQLLGTPAYMSPEQAGGEAHLAGPGSDVYSLGVVLYQALTGELPFRGNSQMLLKQVIEDEPTPPRRLNGAIPSDLETICLKCIEKAPQRRYRSAQALAEDLGRFLENTPILARPVSSAEHAWRWCQRRPAVAGLCSALLGVFLIGSIVSSAYAAIAARRAVEALQARDEEQRQRQYAEHQEKRALAGELAARRSHYAANMHLAQRAWDEKEFGVLQGLLNETVPAAGESDLRGWEWRYLQEQCDKASVTLTGHSIAWNPKRLELAIIYGDKGNYRIKFWLPGIDPVMMRSIPVPSDMQLMRWGGLKWTPDGEHVAVGFLDGRVVFLNPRTGGVANDISSLYGGGMYSFHLSGDGKQIAANNVRGKIAIWDTATGRLTREVDQPKQFQHLHSISINADATRLVTASNRSWNLETGDFFQYLPRQTTGIGQVRWNPRGDHFAVATNDKVVLYALEHPHAVHEFSHRSVFPIAWVDNQRIASSGNDQLIRVWDTEKRSLLQELKLHTEPVRELDVSHDGQLIASSTRRDIRVTRTTKRAGAFDLLASGNKTRHTYRYSLAWDKENRRLAAAFLSNVWVWDTREQEILQRNTLDNPRSLAWTRNDESLFVTTYWGRAFEWTLATKSTEAFTKNPPVEAAISSMLSPNGRWWIVGNEKQAELTDRRSGKTEFTFPCRSPSGIDGYRWSRDSTKLAVARGNHIDIIDPLTGPCFGWTVTDGRTRAISFGWSPDKALLAIACADGRVHVYEAESFEPIKYLAGHSDEVNDVDWSRDAQRVASASKDGTVKIWEPTTGSELLSFKHPDGRSFLAVAWSGDGRRLAAGDNLGNVFIWGAEPTNRKTSGQLYR